MFHLTIASAQGVGTETVERLCAATVQNYLDRARQEVLSFDPDTIYVNFDVSVESAFLDSLCAAFGDSIAFVEGDTDYHMVVPGRGRVIVLSAAHAVFANDSMATVGFSFATTDGWCTGQRLSCVLTNGKWHFQSVGPVVIE